MKNKIIINLPTNIKILVWKKKLNNSKQIVLFLENKYFKLIQNPILFIDKWNNSLIFNKKLHNNIKQENEFLCFFKSLNIFYFSKIKFKGKGFRIKFFKKIKLIKFFFGKSHKTFVLLKKINKKKISKYKFIIFGLNKIKLLLINKVIVNIKKINLYTLRGLRSSRQIIFKRKGKKGTYI